jgi:predicted permease
MQKRMIEAIAAIPGISSVGLVDRAPLVDRAGSASVFFEQALDLTPSNSAAVPTVRGISPGYFRAAATPLLAGRDFTWQDDENSPRVAVINQVLARKLFGSEANALGKYFKLQDGSRVQVVGISEDGKYDSVTDPPGAAMFFPFQQAPSSATSLVVRSNLDSEQLSKAIRGAVRSLDSGLPVYAQNWYEGMDTNLFPSRMAAASLSVLGVMGAMLSVTGIFGLAAYSVSKRKRELGIRIALGARRREVLEAALGRALKLLAIGSATGLLLGILATRVLASIVYEATPRDPIVLAGVILAMVLLGLLATWIPAQRALAIDPSMLMREE